MSGWIWKRGRGWEAWFQGSVSIWDLGQKALRRGRKAADPVLFRLRLLKQYNL